MMGETWENLQNFGGRTLRRILDKQFAYERWIELFQNYVQW